MKLSEVLKKHTVKELKDMSKAFGIAGYSKLKKDELIEYVEASLLNYETAKQVFLCADEEEMDIFKRALSGETAIPQEEYYKCIYFFVSGYYFLTEDNGIIIPDEVKDLYEKIFTAEFMEEKARFDLVLKYCVACTNLYGIVPYAKVVEIFNEQNEEKTCVEEVLADYRNIGLREVFFYLEGEYFVHEAVSNEEEFNILQDKQGDKPYYIPAKEELLKYSNDDYYDRNEAFLNLKEYIVKNILTDEEKAEELCDDLQLSCCFGEGPGEALNQFLIREIEFKDEEQLRDIANLLSELNNTTRMWDNRGFTPQEIYEVGHGEEPQVIVPMTRPATYVREEKKIGRNDKCPCGSGRKYKHCCGR
ncbi:MAG: SEC-C domain-containing protein [Clostridium sp.]|nr:SEC-C domain-containing protein [Clostridium sp.]